METVVIEHSGNPFWSSLALSKAVGISHAEVLESIRAIIQRNGRTSTGREFIKDNIFEDRQQPGILFVSFEICKRIYNNSTIKGLRV